MSICKCGLSEQYPQCDGTHNVIAKHEKLRQAIKQAFEDNKNQINKE